MFVAGLISGALVASAFLALMWLAHSERTHRASAEKRLAETEKRLAALEDELANLNRVRQNRLYRERLEDVGFAASQGALRVAALRSQMEEELRVIEAILGRTQE